MKINRIIIGVLFVLFAISSFNLNAQNNGKTKFKIKEKTFTKKNGKYYVTDSLGNALELIDSTSIIIKFKNSITPNQKSTFESRYNLSFVSITQNGLNIYKVTGINSMILCDSIQNHNLIGNISVPIIATLQMISNDSQRNNQWGLDRININNAWGETTGDNNITIAIIDNGVDWSHEDLGLGSDSYQSLCYNIDEDAWSDPNDPTTGNGIDDDGNGKVDDWKWWNFHDNNNNTNPSNTGSKRNHGTVCAGVIGAKTNNSTGISGICGGWNSKGVSIMPVKVGDGNGATDVSIYNGIKYACDNGAEIISISMGALSDVNGLYQAAVDYAEAAGVILVAASGNTNPGFPPYTWGLVHYPANCEYAISVGNIEDDDAINSNSCFQGNLDISAPGTDILSTSLNNTYSSYTGTSLSCPIVAGTIGLMLSKNPCLSSSQVDDIIKKTSSNINNSNYSSIMDHPDLNPTGAGVKSYYNERYGYAILDAYEAVKTAGDLICNTYNLAIRDNEDDDLYGILDDFAKEPNPNPYPTSQLWKSPDIWVRNQQDPGDPIPEHQNPEYDPSNPVYVYVRIRNNGCQPSSAIDDVLYLHWAKASAGMLWPNNWNGTIVNPTMGNLIQSVVIPSIPAGEEYILEIPWYVPDPNNYTSINGEQWHFCLLARIVSENDQMFLSEGSYMNQNLYYNNNICMKNVTVVDLQKSSEINPGGVIAIGNPPEDATLYKIQFNFNDIPDGDLFNEAEVLVRLDNTTWEKWLEGGGISNGISVYDENTLRINEQNATIENLFYSPDEFSTIFISFNFLTDRAKEFYSYKFNVIQVNQDTDEIYGGEVYEIFNYNRPHFEAEAISDRSEINEGEAILLNAVDINESALYIWRNHNDSIIKIGKSVFNYHPKNNKSIILEVISNKDGYKDYDTLYIKVKSEFIKSLSPNPASNLVKVKLKLDKNKNYNLDLINSSNSVLKSISLNGNTNKIILSISSYAPGIYILKLSDNIGILDVKQLNIN